MTLAEVRTNVKLLLDRNYSGADTAVDLCINSACELIGRNIPAVYEEQQWQHTFDASDTSGNVDNFALPDNTNFIRTAVLIDTDGDEYVFKPLIIISPDDAYDTDKLEGYRNGSYSFYTNSRVISETWSLGDFRSGFGSVGRTNRSGEPEFVYRLGSNVHIQPRSNADIEGWLLRLLLQMFPSALAVDGDTNTITLNYPHALIHLASGIMWASRLHDQQRAQAEFTLGAQFLSSIATNDQIGKLINIQTKMIV